MNSSAILPVVLELLAKSAAILGAASLFHFALRRNSAAKLYYVWAGAFAALLFLPLTKLTPPLWLVSLQKPQPIEIALSAPTLSLEPIRVSSPVPAVAPLKPTTIEVKRTDWPGIAIFAWLAGGLLILGYQLIGRIRLAVIERRSAEVDDPRMSALMQAAVEEAAVKRPIALRASGDIRVPITWRTWRPILLLPKDWPEWSDARLVAVLRHELAHIVRHDYFARRLAQLVVALYWPNPLAWLAGAALRRTQEQACDDRVLRHGTPATDYATLLFESVRALSRHEFAPRQALAMARPSSLESRVVAIVDDTRDRRPGGLLAMSGFIAFVATALTFSALAQVESGSPLAKPPVETKPLASDKSAESVSGFEPVPFTLQPSGNSLTNHGASVIMGSGSVKVPQNNPPIGGAAAKELMRKANSLILPSFETKKATLRECLDFLRKKSVELDPEKKGVDFVLKMSPEDPVAKTPITLTLKDVPLTEAIKYVTNLANVRWRVEPNAIVIAALSDSNADVLFQREYRLPLETGSGDMPAFLKRAGVTFPEGASSVYIARTGRLIVRNTQENLDLINLLLEQLPNAASVVVEVPGKPKLEKIIIPRLQFQGVKLAEAVEFLSQRIRELDPEKRGVNLELAGNFGSEEALITISLSNIPAWEALKYVTNLGGAKYRSESEDRIVIEPLNAVSLITKLYRVPARSISTKEGVVKGPDGVTYASPYEFFTAFGVTFPPGASAGLPVSGDTIVMRNTQANLDLGEVLILALLDADGGKLPDKKLDELQRTLKNLKAFQPR